jgi:hypothetical protein
MGGVLGAGDEWASSKMCFKIPIPVILLGQGEKRWNKRKSSEMMRGGGQELRWRGTRVEVWSVAIYV